MASLDVDRADLERRLRNARRLNVVLGACAVFLLVIALAFRAQDDDSGTRVTAGRTAAGAEGDGSGDTGTGADDPAAEGGASEDPEAGAGEGEGDAATSGVAPDRSFAPAGHPYVLGDADAPVVLSEFVDLRCPFCALFTNDTFPTLVQEYVDTGEVRVEIHVVSYFGDESTDGGVALLAAAEQGRWHEYLVALYAGAPDKGKQDLPAAKLVALAREVGVADLARFEEDLSRSDLRAEVERATREAQQLGVSSVPFFVVGDQAVAGAQPIDTFRRLLDHGLSAAGAS